MKKLSVQLSQDYKSFGNGFSAEFEGDLIILSGVNGSGKSQLIDVISQRENHGGRTEISANITLDNARITRSDILRRSFKENISAPDFTDAGTEAVKHHKEQAWNAYHRYRLNYNHEQLWDFKNSCEIAKEILVKEFGQQKFDSGNITQIELRDKLPISFIWQSDDIFTNVIGSLFFNYANYVNDKKIESVDKGEQFNSTSLDLAPWQQLNDLFRELKLEYRFKDNYYVKGLQINEQPRLYAIDTNGIINENQSRRLSDLSDGEKSIIALSFASLSGVKQEDKKLLLLDEFDANFNPSLTEVFYKILNKYFISKGILVVIATHSPTTISLAPENSVFYEIFKPNAEASRALQVQRNDYAELQIANRSFYDKISDQNIRISELKKENERLGQVQQAEKPALAVEDKYDQIYKIAWLKLHDIPYDNDATDIDNKFNDNSIFKIYGFESANSVAGLLRSSNMDFYHGKKIIGLFDYDQEGTRQFYCLKKGKKGWGDAIEGDFSEGFYKKRSDHPCFYALLLPIPDSLRNSVSDVRSKNFTSFVAIENLLPEQFLIDSNFCIAKKILDREYFKVKDDKKSEFWKKLSELDKAAFDNFKPLFDKLTKLFESS